MLSTGSVGLWLWLVVGEVQSASRAQSVWEHYQSTDGMPTHTGWILRMDFDVTGDDKPEVFLSNSAMTGNGGGPWVIYSPQRDGSYKVLDEIGFHGRFFRYERASSLFVTGWHRSAAETGLGYYRVDDNGFTRLEHGVCPGFTADCEAELQRIRDWQAEHAPPLYFFNVEDLSSGRANPWNKKLSDEKVELIPLEQCRLVN